MKKITILLFLFCTNVTLFAQSEPIDSLRILNQRITDLDRVIQHVQKLKISGYIQSEYQYAQPEATSGWVKIGNVVNENTKEAFNRIGIRRGRIKFSYTEGIALGVFQLDITEKGIGVKDAYLSINDPWLKSCNLKVGIFERPFGYEISYSSSRRESPERAQIIQTLFPDERDLGAMLTLQMPKTSLFSIFKLETGIFSGNGIKLDMDNKKDFTGHLSVEKPIGTSVQIGGGISYYNGSIYSFKDTIYTMEDKSFLPKLNQQENYIKREYFGLDAHFSINWILGLTNLRGEFIWGTQPSGTKNTKSPNYNTLPDYNSADYLYKRSFVGYYMYLIQEIRKTPFSIVLKYDTYDPNTKVSNNEIGEANTGISKADLAIQTLGIGALWNINKNLLLMAYYEFVDNEGTRHISNYQFNRKDNVLTLRLQYKF